MVILRMCSGKGLITISRSSSRSSTTNASFSLRTRTTSNNKPSCFLLRKVLRVWRGGIRSMSSSATTGTNSLRMITACRSATFKNSPCGTRSSSAIYWAEKPNGMPPTSTSNTRIIANDSGRRKAKVVPAPGRLSTFTTPCRSSTIQRLTTSIPTPRPEISVIIGLVLKPGKKIRSTTSCSLSASAFSSVMKPLRTALSRTASIGMPLPSSAISITTQPPS